MPSEKEEEANAITCKALAVGGFSIRAYLNQYLENYEEREGRSLTSDGRNTLAGYNVYRPLEGFVNKTEVTAAEVLWRMMNHENLFKYETLLDLRLEIAYREYAIAATDSLNHLRFGPELWNSEFWSQGNTPKAQVTAFEGVEDILNHPEGYRATSRGGVYLAHLVALMQAYKEAQCNTDSTAFAIVLRNLQLTSRTARHEDDWLPGDWGTLSRDVAPSTAAPPPKGQEVMYLGGCFRRGKGFKLRARFWGHDSGDLTLQQWADVVCNKVACTAGSMEIGDTRYLFELPKPRGPGLYSDTMIIPGRTPKIDDGTLP